MQASGRSTLDAVFHCRSSAEAPKTTGPVASSAAKRSAGCQVAVRWLERSAADDLWCGH